MLFKPKHRLRQDTDAQLFGQIDHVQKQLLRLKQLQRQGVEEPYRFNDSLKLQQVKFDLLYKEARHRGTKASTLNRGVTYFD